MQQVILADTSVLIVLDNIGELQILTQLFSTVSITAEVLSEYGNRYRWGLK